MVSEVEVGGVGLPIVERFICLGRMCLRVGVGVLAVEVGGRVMLAGVNKAVPVDKVVLVAEASTTDLRQVGG